MLILLNQVFFSAGIGIFNVNIVFFKHHTSGRFDFL